MSPRARLAKLRSGLVTRSDEMTGGGGGLQREALATAPLLCEAHSTLSASIALVTAILIAHLFTDVFNAFGDMLDVTLRPNNVGRNEPRYCFAAGPSS